MSLILRDFVALLCEESRQEDGDEYRCHEAYKSMNFHERYALFQLPMFECRQDRCNGAMNSGPTGSVIVSLRMRSILASASASSVHPATDTVGCS